MSKESPVFVSKKTRFEVFKRDGFTCQYCGAKAPDVKLQIDHIFPVSSGGQTTMENLVTACSDCNAGKGKRCFFNEQEVSEKVKKLQEDYERKEKLRIQESQNQRRLIETEPMREIPKTYPKHKEVKTMPDKTIERIVRFMDILISIPENKREAVAASMEMLAAGAAIAVNTEEVKT